MDDADCSRSKIIPGLFGASERARACVCAQRVSHAPCTLPARPSLCEKVVGPWAIADPLYCLSQIHADPHSHLNALSLSLSLIHLFLFSTQLCLHLQLSMFQAVFLSLWSVILALRPANNNINRRAHPCPRKGPDKGVNLVVAPDLNALMMMMMGMINGSNNEIDQRS